VQRRHWQVQPAELGQQMEYLQVKQLVGEKELARVILVAVWRPEPA
jgi:hypothetical protein